MSICFKSLKNQKLHDTELCERNLNLLAHAQCIELEIGSRCGGYGECGGDRIKIDPSLKDSFSPITDAEREHLTEEQIKNGWRLACQCYPESNELAVTAEF
jgi:ferredoxin